MTFLSFYVCMCGKSTRQQNRIKDNWIAEYIARMVYVANFFFFSPSLPRHLWIYLVAEPVSLCAPQGLFDWWVRVLRVLLRLFVLHFIYGRFCSMWCGYFNEMNQTKSSHSLLLAHPVCANVCNTVFNGPSSQIEKHQLQPPRILYIIILWTISS